MEYVRSEPILEGDEVYTCKCTNGPHWNCYSAKKIRLFERLSEQRIKLVEDKRKAWIYLEHSEEWVGNQAKPYNYMKLFTASIKESK